jgi:Protein of unknown function (DUF2695)
MRDKCDEHRCEQVWEGPREIRARTGLPLPDPELADLFATLERQGALAGCDHTLRMSLAWLSTRGHEPGPVVAWLQATGGYCDCEVLLNSMHEWTCGREGG